MKRLRDVLRRLPSLFEGGAFDAACREIRRVVPIDQLGLARVADDGSHLRLYMGWTSDEVGVPAVEWAQRIDVTRERLALSYPKGEHRICRNTLESPEPAERAIGEAGILCTISVPIGDPLTGLIGFGFKSAARLRDEHLPLLRRIAAMLLDRLDFSLLAAHAARLRTITQAMPMGAIMLSREGTVEEVNPAAARLFGCEARQLVGRSIRDLISAPDGGLLGWRIDEANGPAPARVRTPDGTLPVRAQLAAVRREIAQPHLYGPLFLVDTSVEEAASDALLRRTEELRRLEREHRRIVDNLPVMVYATGPTGRCSYVSRAIERLLGYTPEQIYAMPDFSALNIDEVPREYHTRAEGFERDFRQRHRDGREVVMRYTGRVLVDESGQVLGSEGFGVDVTAERDAQHKLLLADRLSALGMLVAGIGHEINNPAAYVSLGVQQIARHLRGARKQPGDEMRNTLERALPILDDVAAGVHRIAEIVGELKLFARNPDGDTPGPIDLNGIVRSAAALVQAELRSRARLTLDLGELPAVPGSWARLSQVALNLLINAAQALPAGAPQANEVAVSTRLVAGEVRIVVRDSGCGIPPAALQRIFDPFYTTKAVGEGTGLGLAISYDIVRRLGGNIGVVSELGRGTSFTVTLPHVAVSAVAPAHPTAAAEPSGSVLIVDDERALASAIARELGVRMQVELVHSGGEALRALGRDRFDAVLCDLRMPDLSGAEVYKRTHARDREQAERFVFLTGAAGAAGEADFLRSAGRPVLEKPFAMAELWRTVGAVVGAP
ncbi:MAG: Sensor histidine kinase [bacterium]|nr:Sensor histidine kinase [bacterium]